MLHRRAAEVEVPMLQAQALVEAGLLLVDVERRHLRRVEDLEPIHRDLDVARRELRVGGPGGPLAHDAFDLEDPFVARRIGGARGPRRASSPLVTTWVMPWRSRRSKKARCP